MTLKGGFGFYEHMLVELPTGLKEMDKDKYIYI